MTYCLLWDGLTRQAFSYGIRGLGFSLEGFQGLEFRIEFQLAGLYRQTLYDPEGFWHTDVATANLPISAQKMSAWA